ncbi:hypothetical protein [Deinococcus sp. QL22]|uniref:alpha/beta hydrolase family protein n=1 Tax=Deinococcus sp. QL22 TaxID=2939437 RepID=UPI002017309C|nr:hypothetical protein [Deinococcus sp. QL22]UQN09448.1 hypothetical protein M1R55_23110 [Deinococcus sp. QL22]
MLATLAHVVFEGWRIHMVPLYLLAALLLLSRLRLRDRALKVGHPRLRLLGTGVVLALAGAFPAWLLPVVTLPAPTGRYAVGVVDRELNDPVRARRLMVSVWYPAAKKGARAPLTLYSEKMAAGLTRAFGLPAAAPLLQHLRYFTSSASLGAPMLSSAPPFPVLVFSHGLVGVRLQNSGTFQELASRGFVVVALDHTDAAAVTVFPDGEARGYDLQRLGIRPEELGESTRVLLPIWVADQRLVYDTLTTWQASDPLFAGRLDVRRMGSFGHSFGGVTAFEVCRVELRCRAAVNLDGGLPQGGLLPAQRPVLLMTSSHSNSLEYAIQRWRRYVQAAKAPAMWLEVSGTNHYSFTIMPLMLPLIAPRSYDPAAGQETADHYLNVFFDLQLRGVPTGLFDRPVQTAVSKTGVLWRE